MESSVEWSVECGVLSVDVKCGVCSVECGRVCGLWKSVWSVWSVWNVKCGV